MINKKLFDKVEYSKRIYIEDAQTYVKLVYFANKIVNIGDNGETYYHYRRHEKSLTSRKNNKEKTIFFYALCALDIYEFVTYEQPNEIFQKYYSKFYLRNNVNGFFKNSKIDKEKMKKLYPNEYNELVERWDKIKVTLDCY